MASGGQSPLPQRTVIVTSIPPATSDAALEAYFQDRKKGGGELASPIKRTESAAYITFKDPNVAAGLVSRLHIFGPARTQLGVNLQPDTTRLASASSSPQSAPGSPFNSGLSSSFSNDLNSAGSTSGGPGYPSSNSSNVSEDRFRLKVSNIPPNITKTHIELYFKKQAGGVAPEVEYDATSSTAYLIYRSQEAANKVLTAHNALNKLPVMVTADDVPPSNKSVTADEGATLVVSKIPPGISQRHIELYFKKQAGGMQPSVEYDVAAGIARLHFNDKEVAMRVAGLNNALNKEPVTVTLDQLPKEETSGETNTASGSGASGKAAVVFVTGIHPDVTKTHIELYFKKHAGVQPVVQYDAKRQAARLTFPSFEAARLILEQEHKLNKVLVKVALVDEAEGFTVNGIEVANVEPKYEELVRLYFMEFGFIDSFQYLPHDKKLLLRFGDARTAEAVLQKTPHDIISDSLQVAAVPLMSDVLVEDDTTAAHESATVLVTGIPPDVHEKHVQLYFKSAALSGGGEVSSVVYARGSGTAQITFACSSVARRVCAVGNHKINKATISVTPLYDHQNTDWEDLVHIYGNDYRSCAIMVENIPSCVIEDHLRLYFGDSKCSDGGPIKKIYYNRRSGVAVIVFHDTEVAKRLTSKGVHQLCGHTLQVGLLQNEAKCTDQVLYISGFADLHDTRESLWWWLSAAAGVLPQALHFSADHSAVLAFFKCYVAQNVIPFSCFYGLGGRLLEVKRIPETKTLFISNLPGDASRKMLMYYLEHPNNGGTANCVQNIDVINGNAYKVSLTSADVLRSITEKDRIMDDQVLTLLPFYDEIGEVSEHQQFKSQDGPSCGVVGVAPPLLILEGFSFQSDENTVIEFYESLKEDDKGNAAAVHFRDGELRGQLTSADVAGRIIRQSEQGKLLYSGTAISAKFRQQRLTTDMKRNMLLVRNVNGILSDHLRYFLWALSGVPVVEMSEITDRGNRSCTLVKFARALAFTDDEALPWLPANLCGAPFDVELVPKPRCVYARNMPAEATQEYITMLFANSGAKVVGSIPAPNKGFIIEFSCSQDADRVLKQRIFYEGILALDMVAYYQPIA